MERPDELGATVGRGELLDADEDNVLPELLAATDASRAHFGLGFALGRTQGRGRQWAETKLAGPARRWSPVQRAGVLLCLPADDRTWDIAEAADAETDEQYWRRVHPYSIREPRYVERGTSKLLQHGRPCAAVDLLAVNAGRETTLSPVLIADALERALEPAGEHDSPSFAYHVSELLDLLEQSGQVDETRIARLEWAFLPLLERREHLPRLLHRELSRSPAFFAQLVGLVFRAEGEEPRQASPEERARAERAHELLESWRTVPGTAEGSIGADELRRWVQQAREAQRAGRRVATGDQMIGQVLSGSPVGPDGAWPHSAVREVIEEVESVELERGMEVGLYNSRGVFSKALGEGGAQERVLEQRYAGFAAAMGNRWPRTAAMLRRIADRYRAEAQRADQDAELREHLDH